MEISALCLKTILIHYCRRAGLRVFYSAAISKRHETTTVEATDGIIITVSGFINRSRTHENGFPPKVCMLSATHCSYFSELSVLEPLLNYSVKFILS